MKYIDADKLKSEINRLKGLLNSPLCESLTKDYKDGGNKQLDLLFSFIDSLHQEQPIPDSTHLIAEWEKEKAVLEQKGFRGDAERMAYNAFLDGFVKGIGYDGTR